jgi:pimeloyl-ACP methyl ester carboxylesterase
MRQLTLRLGWAAFHLLASWRVKMKSNMKIEPGCISWNWEGKEIRLGYDRVGVGPQVLLLPALSSISTRREMQPLQERLATSYSTVAIDWPGFGDKPRPPILWRPKVYTAFLRHVLIDLFPHPVATVAAGHAASYALAVAAASHQAAGLLCLIAPTWRGPLPTMLGGRPWLGRWMAHVGDLPILGQLLYRLNVNIPIVRMMARGHVYADPTWLVEDGLAQKLAVVNAPGARRASIRFVTGMLDPMLTRSSFIETARRVHGPMLVIYGAGTPTRSKAEMIALVALPHVLSVELPIGKLGIHEEFPDSVAGAIMTFLAEFDSDDQLQPSSGA